MSAGLTPIEVAGNQGNVSMKLLLESSALFKGTLAFKIPRMFGDKTKDRQVHARRSYLILLLRSQGSSCSLQGSVVQKMQKNVAMSPFERHSKLSEYLSIID